VSTPYIGIAICHKGVYPEIVRGLTLNGAEIIIRPTLIVNGMGELQNRAHAMFNQVFVVAPNLGPEIRKDGGIQDLFGGQSMIFNARGQIVAQQKGWTSGDSFVRTTIDTPGRGIRETSPSGRSTACRNATNCGRRSRRCQTLRPR
jgi:predicted amidohydrolase